MSDKKKPLPKRKSIPVREVEDLVTDGSNFYLASDKNKEYPLTVVQQIGDDPGNWTFRDQGNRTYTPHRNVNQGEITESVKNYNTLGGPAKVWDNIVDWANTVDANSPLAPLARTIRETREGNNPVVNAAQSFDPFGITHIVPELVYKSGTSNLGTSDIVNAGLLTLPYVGKSMRMVRKFIPKGIRLKMAGPEVAARFQREPGGVAIIRETVTPKPVETSKTQSVQQEFVFPEETVVPTPSEPVLQGKTNTVSRETAQRAMRIAKESGKREGAEEAAKTAEKAKPVEASVEKPIEARQPVGEQLKPEVSKPEVPKPEEQPKDKLSRLQRTKAKAKSLISSVPKKIAVGALAVEPAIVGGIEIGGNAIGQYKFNQMNQDDSKEYNWTYPYFKNLTVYGLMGKYGESKAKEQLNPKEDKTIQKTDSAAKATSPVYVNQSSTIDDITNGWILSE